jgi:hypothetical protein
LNRQLLVLAAVCAFMVLPATAQSAGLSSCTLQKITYHLEIHQGRPYLYLHGYVACESGLSPQYQWYWDTENPLGKLHDIQYTWNYGKIHRFPLYYGKDKSQRALSAGVTFNFGVNNADFGTCYFEFSGHRPSGVIRRLNCAKGSSVGITLA